MAEENLNEMTTSRFLDLECVSDFQIEETNGALAIAKQQKAKKILDELLNDPTVKGKIRKKMLKAAKLLDSED